jgi:hypothetical protein
MSTPDSMVEAVLLPCPQSPSYAYFQPSSFAASYNQSSFATPTRDIRKRLDRMIIRTSSPEEELLPSTSVASTCLLGSDCSSHSPSPGQVSPIEDGVAAYRRPFKKRLRHIGIISSSWRSLEDSDDDEEQDLASIPPILVRQHATVYTVTAVHAALLLQFSSSFKYLLPYSSPRPVFTTSPCIDSCSFGNMANEHLRRDPASSAKIEVPESWSALRLGGCRRRATLYPSALQVQGLVEHDHEDQNDGFPLFASEGLIRDYDAKSKRDSMKKSASPTPTKKHCPCGVEKPGTRKGKQDKEERGWNQVTGDAANTADSPSFMPNHPCAPMCNQDKKSVKQTTEVPQPERQADPTNSYRPVRGPKSIKNGTLLQLHQMLLSMHRPCLDDVSQVITVPSPHKRPPKSSDRCVSRRGPGSPGLKPAPIYSTSGGQQDDKEHLAWRVQPSGSHLPRGTNEALDKPAIHGRSCYQGWNDSTSSARVEGPKPPFSPIATTEALRAMFAPRSLSVKLPPRRSPLPPSSYTAPLPTLPYRKQLATPADPSFLQDESAPCGNPFN